MTATIDRLHPARWPNESTDYRVARDKLLQAEIALRRQVEQVATLRRALPPGGPVPEDYVFEEGPEDPAADGPAARVRLSQLFADGHDTLITYGLMYPPGGNPCPMCTAFLDGLAGNARHLAERLSLAVIGKAPLAQLRGWATLRGWRFAHLLSSAGTSFNRDYHAEAEDGSQQPMVNVFRRDADVIRHVWASELFLVPAEPGQHPRHVDLLWPLWSLLDLTPAGRGDWIPMTSYRQCLEALQAGSPAPI